jgi:hypothetical protein
MKELVEWFRQRRAEQSLAADGSIASFSSKFFPPAEF